MPGPHRVMMQSKDSPKLSIADDATVANWMNERASKAQPPLPLIFQIPKPTQHLLHAGDRPSTRRDTHGVMVPREILFDLIISPDQCEKGILDLPRRLRPLRSYALRSLSPRHRQCDQCSSRIIEPLTNVLRRPNICFRPPCSLPATRPTRPYAQPINDSGQRGNPSRKSDVIA